MNKNYSNIVMMAMVGLAAFNGLLGLEVPSKECIATDKNPLKTAVKNYILSYCALYGSVPVASASFIKVCTGAPLKNSMTDFKNISRDMNKLLLKTMPITASIACSYGKYNQNLGDYQ